MTKGRRLRLDRRKAGLSQEELAERLGHTVEEISKMERDVLELSTSAQAFCANVPAAVPGKGTRGKRAAAGPQAAPEPELAGVEDRDGPGPRVELPDDKPPQPGQVPRRDLAPVPRGEIAELEDALLKMFAGERLIVPRQTPEGVVQVEAVIPGIAQVVAMYDQFDGQIIETYSPGMAKAWAELARVNPGVRKVLMGLTYGGAYRGVLAATLPPLLAITAHHGWLPMGGGPPPPPDIEAQPHHEPDAPPPEWNGGVPVEVETLFEADLGDAPQ